MDRSRLLLAVPVATVGLGADQLAKVLVRARLPVCDQFPIVSCARSRFGPLTLVRMQNSGTGYLFLRNPNVAIGLALFGCVLLFVYAVWFRRATWVAVLGVGLQAGGALSNLMDRFVVGSVSDYVNVSPTFTFNLADVLLLVGMTLAVASIARALAGGDAAS